MCWHIGVAGIAAWLTCHRSVAREPVRSIRARRPGSLHAGAVLRAHVHGQSHHLVRGYFRIRSDADVGADYSDAEAALDAGVRHQRKLPRFADGLNAKIDVELRPVEMLRRRPFHITDLGNGGIAEPRELRER